jgi:precorrin-2 dehydrogenase/sirohydrochlorin ferrochelatase
MNLFPVFLNITDKDCLVVGGGKVALRKIKSLLTAGARIRVISPEILPDINQLAENKSIKLFKKKFEEKDIGCPFLVISATNCVRTNKMIAELCFEKNIPVNVIDDPSKCTFQIPAVVRRGDLNIAVSTNGKSPMLAASLRKKIEEQFGVEYEIYIKILGDVRKRLLNEIPDEEKRRSILKKIIQSDLLKLIKNGEESRLKERIEECIYS